MVNVICDSCKKSVSDAKPGINVFFVLDKTLCKPCEEQIDSAVREQMKKEKEFTLKDFKNKFTKEMEKQCK